MTGWKVYQGEILQVALPGAREGKWKSRQLFFNGQRQIRARTPILDLNDPIYGGWAFIDGSAEKESSTYFRYKASNFSHHWAKPSEGEVIFYQGGWGSWRSTVPILSVNEQDHSTMLIRPGMQFDMAPWYYPPVPFVPGNAIYLENLLEELEQPGEWSLDSEDRLIYFWPPAGKLKTSDEVVIPTWIVWWIFKELYGCNSLDSPLQRRKMGTTTTTREWKAPDRCLLERASSMMGMPCT